MPEYYLDLETNPKGSKPDVEKDEILTIQFQKLDSLSGNPQTDLTILKSWDSSEEHILKQFHSTFFDPNNPFKFVAIGMNLNFDFLMLHNRWKKIGIEMPLETLFYRIPHIDIKPILVILNKGSFKGASLDKFVNKPHTGAIVPELYSKKDYSAIEVYIRNEAEEFIGFYKKLKTEMPTKIL